MVGAVLCTYLILLICINLKPIKEIWIGEVEEELTDLLQSKVDIEDIDIGLFNRVMIKDLIVYDQNNEVILHTNKFSARISLYELIRGNISVRTMLLMDSDIRLYQNSPELPANYQYLVDLFKNPDEQTESSKFNISSLIITRANISFDKRWMTKKEGFDENHIAITNLNTNLSLSVQEQNKIRLRVRNFSCAESCGFNIENINLIAESNSKEWTINKAKITLPNSEIATKGSFYVGLDSLNPSLLGDIKVHNLAVQDFNRLYPPLAQSDFTFRGNINCTKREDSVSQISVAINEVKNHFNLDFTANCANFSNYNLSLQTLSADSLFISHVTKILNNKHGEKLNRLKHISLNGDANYDVKSQSGNVNFNMKSPVTGDVIVKSKLLDQKLNLDLITRGTNLQTLIDSKVCPDSLTLSANLQALVSDSTFRPQQLNLHILAAKNDNYYNLSDINSNFNFNNNSVRCKIKSNHPDLRLSLDGSCMYSNNHVSNIKLDSKVQHIDLAKFGVRDSLLKGIWSGNVRLIIPKLTEKNLSVDLRADSIIANRSSQPFKVQNLVAQLDYKKNAPSKFNLYSDPISINAEGVLDHTTIFETIKSTLTQHISTFNTKESFRDHTTHEYKDNSLSFLVNVHKGDFLHDMFFIPLEVSDGTTIEGQLSKDKSNSFISTRIERVNLQDFELENLSLHFQSKKYGASMLLQARKKLVDDNLQFVLGAQLTNDLLETNMEWDCINQHNITGSINAITNFQPDSSIVTTILPTTLLLADSIWNISKGEIYIKDQKHYIKNLTINTSEQAITLNGGISQTYRDSLRVSFNNINVGDIFEKIKYNKLIFEGLVSGDVNLSLSPGLPLLKSQLKVKSFKFNKALLGDADINATWVSLKDKINLRGDFVEENVGYTRANGYICPANDSIDLRITANKTNLTFLTHWVKHFIQDINGSTSGFCRLHGTLTDLDMSGLMKINTSLYLPVNGVTYNLNEARVVINPGVFNLEEGVISSTNGGSGRVHALINHNKFRNFRYDLSVDANNLLLYDKSKQHNMPFYGTVFANGNVNLNGGLRHLTLNIDATPTNNSLIVYTENNGIGTHNSNDGVINYRNVSQDSNSEYSLPLLTKINAPQTDMRFRFNINMNPSATLRVLMDEVSGDHLNLIGNGTLVADYYNKGAFQLYGNYELTGGSYQMSIQDVLKRNFEIQNGSSIIFGGNPDNAQLSLKAIYTVSSASLADLNIGENFSDRNIKANCILNIGGTASNPNVNFDLDLPNINDDEKQMVRKLITTEEDMNMQVIYLLTLGRFYTYDYTVSQNNKQSQSTVAANSFLSSTLSSQVNEVISQALGSNNWTFGTNFTTGTSGWTDMEIDGAISGKLLNNRLHLYGNIGYHENQYNAMRGTNFVGDFDARFLLTPNGGILLKAYSETNDKYFTKSALTTQGLGIQFQKDFTKLKELFTSTKRRIPKKLKTDSINSEGNLQKIKL